MKPHKVFLSLLALIFILSACSQAKATSTASSTVGETGTSLVSIKLPVGYVPDIQFAPLYVAIEKGFYHDEGLEVTIDYSMENDNAVLVGTGDLTFAIVSGEQVLLARAQQLPIVYIMSWYHQYPVAIAARSSIGVKTIEDLKGKKIGLPGLYGSNYIGAMAMLDAAGLSQKDVTFDSIGYNQVAALAAKQEDAVVIYSANEPLQLKKEGVDFTLFKTSDYVDLVANGMITNEDTIKGNPELVRRMVRATLKGIQYTTDHPEEAYSISEKYVENLSKSDQQIQMQILKNSIEMWKTDQPGVTDPKAWENMQALLLKMGLINQSLDLTSAYSNDYLPK
jgi:NitT/TauT family transport system substrate-binding protein